jgi:hypothetical protein
MSWNGTVRCGHCYGKGHNKRTCPDLKKYIEENPDSYRARLKATKDSQTRPRRCSYCQAIGHNRRTCTELTSDRTKAQGVNEKWCNRVADLLKERGLGIGALVEAPGSWKTDYEKTVSMVVGFNWNEANFTSMNNSYVGDFIMVRSISDGPASSDGETRSVRLPKDGNGNLQDNHRGEWYGRDAIFTVLSGVGPETIEFPDRFLDGEIGIDGMFVEGNRNECNMLLIDRLALGENSWGF